MIRVLNLATGDELHFDRDIGPRQAVLCAYAQETRRDYAWERYEERYGDLVVTANGSVGVGDFATRLAPALKHLPVRPPSLATVH